MRLKQVVLILLPPPQAYPPRDPPPPRLWNLRATLAGTGRECEKQNYFRLEQGRCCLGVQPGGGGACRRVLWYNVGVHRARLLVRQSLLSLLSNSGWETPTAGWRRAAPKLSPQRPPHHRSLGSILTWVLMSSYPEHHLPLLWGCSSGRWAMGPSSSANP